MTHIPHRNWETLISFVLENQEINWRNYKSGEEVKKQTECMARVHIGVHSDDSSSFTTQNSAGCSILARDCWFCWLIWQLSFADVNSCSLLANVNKISLMPWLQTLSKWFPLDLFYKILIASCLPIYLKNNNWAAVGQCVAVALLFIVIDITIISPEWMYCIVKLWIQHS